MRKTLALTTLLQSKENSLIQNKFSRSLSPRMGKDDFAKNHNYIRYTRSKDLKQPYDNSILLTEGDQQNQIVRISAKQLLENSFDEKNRINKELLDQNNYQIRSINKLGLYLNNKECNFNEQKLLPPISIQEKKISLGKIQNDVVTNQKVQQCESIKLEIAHFTNLLKEENSCEISYQNAKGYQELREVMQCMGKQIEQLVVCKDQQIYSMLEKISNQVIFERSKQLSYNELIYIFFKEVGGWLKKIEEGTIKDIHFPKYTAFNFAQDVLSARDVYKKNSTIVEMKKKVYEIDQLQAQVASLKAKLDEQQKQFEQKFNEKVKEKDQEIIELRQKIRDQKEECDIIKQDNNELQKSLIQISQLIKTNAFLEERTKIIMESTPMNTRYNVDNNFKSAYLKIENRDARMKKAQQQRQFEINVQKAESNPSTPHKNLTNLKNSEDQDNLNRMSGISVDHIQLKQLKYKQ